MGLTKTMRFDYNQGGEKQKKETGNFSRIPRDSCIAFAFTIGDNPIPSTQKGSMFHIKSAIFNSLYDSNSTIEKHTCFYSVVEVRYAFLRYQ